MVGGCRRAGVRGVVGVGRGGWWMVSHAVRLRMSGCREQETERACARHQDAQARVALGGMEHGSKTLARLMRGALSRL